MKFQLLGDWPVQGGAMVVPAGEVIGWEPDAEKARVAGLPTTPKWRGQPLPIPMPLNAKAMDQEAYDAMVAWYTPIMVDGFLNLLHYANGVQPKKGAANG